METAGRERGAARAPEHGQEPPLQPAAINGAKNGRSMLRIERLTGTKATHQ
jgi:hypothetical protein